MWRIIKAEISYNRWFLLLPAALVLAPIFANVWQGWPRPAFDLLGIRTMMTAALGIAGLSILLRFYQEKRERRHVLLPVSLATIGRTRLGILFSIWLAFLLCYLAGSATVHPYLTDQILWHSLALTGFIGIIIAGVFIFRDILVWAADTSWRYLMVGGYVLAVLLVYAIWYLFFAAALPYFEFLEPVNQLNTQYRDSAGQLMWAVLLNGVSLLAMGASIMLFKKRPTYGT